MTVQEATSPHISHFLRYMTDLLADVVVVVVVNFISTRIEE